MVFKILFVVGLIYFKFMILKFFLLKQLSKTTESSLKSNPIHNYYGIVKESFIFCYFLSVKISNFILIYILYFNLQFFLSSNIYFQDFLIKSR